MKIVVGADVVPSVAVIDGSRGVVGSARRALEANELAGAASQLADPWFNAVLTAVMRTKIEKMSAVGLWEQTMAIGRR